MLGAELSAPPARRVRAVPDPRAPQAIRSVCGHRALTLSARLRPVVTIAASQHPLAPDPPSRAPSRARQLPFGRPRVRVLRSHRLRSPAALVSAPFSRPPLVRPEPGVLASRAEVGRACRRQRGLTGGRPRVTGRLAPVWSSYPLTIPEGQRPTMRGFKIAHADLSQQIRTQQAEGHALKKQRVLSASVHDTGPGGSLRCGAWTPMATDRQGSGSSGAGRRICRRCGGDWTPGGRGVGARRGASRRRCGARPSGARAATGVEPVAAALQLKVAALRRRVETTAVPTPRRRSRPRSSSSGSSAPPPRASSRSTRPDGAKLSIRLTGPLPDLAGLVAAFRRRRA